MKKIIVAPDSFKESLSANQVADAIEQGVLAVSNQVEVVKLPVADGGEGTLDVLSKVLPCNEIPSLVSDALGRPLHCYFLLSSHKDIALIEVAQSCGLAQIAPDQRDAMQASSYGVGQQIELAIELGVDEIVLALGGSATNDGGAGLLQALGVRYLGADREEITAVGGNLNLIESIDTSGLNSKLRQIKFTLLHDVTHPLFGDNGASRTFGPQKGASAEQVDLLDHNIKHFTILLEETFGKPLSQIEGAGAAGGIPAVLIATMKAELRSGIDYVLELSQFSKHIQKADLVITGEGRIDTQSTQGKAISGVARLAKNYGIPVIALAGSLPTEDDLSLLYQAGINSVFSICHSPMSLETAFSETKNNLQNISENLLRLYLCNEK